MLLLHTSLLSPVDKGPTQSLPAVRGLTAMYQGQPVFVLDSFMSRGCQKNDVANIRQLASGEWILGGVVTCKSTELFNLRLQYEVTSVARGRVTLRQCCGNEAVTVVDPAQSVHRARAMADEAAEALQHRPLTWMSANPEPLSLRAVKPQAAVEHERQFPYHRVQPRQDCSRFEFCLDVPCPQIWDMTPWRCRSCDSETWPVTAADVDDECLRLGLGTPLRFTQTRHGKVSASPLLLFWLLMMLYRDMNLHEVRRKLLDLYSASTLHAAQMTPSLTNVSQLRWILMCVPDHHAIKDILLSCFADFVQKRVDLMQERQVLFHLVLAEGRRLVGLTRSKAELLVLAEWLHYSDFPSTQRFQKEFGMDGFDMNQADLLAQFSRRLGLQLTVPAISWTQLTPAEKDRQGNMAAVTFLQQPQQWQQIWSNMQWQPPQREVPGGQIKETHFIAIPK